MCGLFEPGARKPQEGSPEEGAEDDKNDGHGAKLSGPEGGGQDPHTGATKNAPVGFSWTMFFFGPFVPIKRGEWMWALGYTILAFATLGLSPAVAVFIYNKGHIKRLIASGYKAKTITGSDFENVKRGLGIEIPQIETE